MPTALMLASEGGISVNGALVVTSFELFGITFNLTESIIIQWFVMLILLVLMLVLTHNMKVVPETKRQVLAEWIVEFSRSMVIDSMGKKYKAYIPYIMTLLCFIVLSNLMGLLGLRAPTADISVTGTLALITFFLVQYNRIKTGKLKGSLKSFVEPVPFMLPFNIIGEFANPLSLAMRLFGNMVAGMAIGSLIYYALGLFMPPVVIPAVTSLYFDLFSAVIQTYIFCMLTMSYISSADCEDG